MLIIQEVEKMALSYMSIPTSAKKLGQEVTRIVDGYTSGQLTEDELTEAIETWKMNVPQLLVDDDSMLVSQKLTNIIGKRRAMVVTTILRKLST